MAPSHAFRTPSLDEAGPSNWNSQQVNDARTAAAKPEHQCKGTFGTDIGAQSLADELFDEPFDDDFEDKNAHRDSRGKSIGAATVHVDAFGQQREDDDLDVTADLTHSAPNFRSQQRQNSFDYVISVFRAQEEEADRMATEQTPSSPWAIEQNPKRVTTSFSTVPIFTWPKLFARHGGEGDVAFEEIELGLYPNAVGNESMRGHTIQPPSDRSCEGRKGFVRRFVAWLATGTR